MTDVPPPAQPPAAQPALPASEHPAPTGPGPAAEATQPAPLGGAFAPVPRGPRVPWVNPARRRHVIGASALGAVIALGVGFGVGIAASGGDHERGERFGHRFGIRGGYGYPVGPYGVPPQRMLPPGGPSEVVPAPATSVPVSPTPSGSSSSK